MHSKKNQWILQSLPINHQLKNSLLQQHHAAQMIALAGHHLIPQKPDDSNTNMQFVQGENILLGNEIPGRYRIALHLEDLTLSIRNPVDIISQTISLAVKTKQQVFDELKQSLADLGVDVSTFKNELHYELPDHPLDHGAVFEPGDKKYNLENTIYRHNAKIILNEMSGKFDTPEPIRVWPHHFDSGAFFPIAYNNKGELSQSIGMGLAIPDGMVDEPYYYLSYWSEKPIQSMDTLPALKTGNWLMPNWNGAVLRTSDLLSEKSSQEQYHLVKDFYTEGIDVLLKNLKEK